jgi:hypothetical protein
MSPIVRALTVVKFLTFWPDRWCAPAVHVLHSLGLTSRVGRSSRTTCQGGDGVVDEAADALADLVPTP